MVRFLKNVLLFTALFCVVNTVVVCAGGELLPACVSRHFVRYKRCGSGHLFSRLQEVSKVKDVDILFIGTSRCYRGFDTRIFGRAGYSSFNLGSSIQTALQTELLLGRYLDSIRPKRVVFEVNPAIFGSDGAESAADVISNDRIDWKTVSMACKVNSYRTYNTLIFGLYRQYTGIGRNLRQPAKLNQDQYIQGGFVESRRFRNDAAKPCGPAEYEFNRNQVRAFERVLTMLRQRKISYVLIQAPTTKALYGSKTNCRIVDSYLSRKGAYYNFNNLLQMDDRYDFFDNDHLSQNGVEKFDQELIAVLRRDGFLR